MSLPNASQGLNLGITQSSLIHLSHPTLSLLGVPVDIRDLVYEYFLKLKQNGRGAIGPKAFDYKIFGICKQIREEAFNYFTRANLWVYASALSDSQRDARLLVGLTQMAFVPFSVFSGKEQAKLVASIALKIQMRKNGDEDRPATSFPLTQRAEREVLFAYNKSQYIFLMLQMQYGLTILYPNVTITLTTRREKPETIVESLLLPLSLVKNSKTLSWQCFPDKPIFKHLILGMKTLDTVQDYQNYLQACKEEGNQFQKDGDYAAALWLYEGGKIVFKQFIKIGGLTRRWYFYHPEINALNSIHVDICNNFALVANRNNDIRGRDLTGHHRSDAFYNLTSALATASKVFEWEGASRMQMHKAHSRRAVATCYLAEYFSFPQNKAYAEKHPSEDGIKYSYVKDPAGLYCCAAQDYYHAWMLAPYTATGKHARAMYEKLSQGYASHSNESLSMAIVDGIDGYEDGTWRGAPNVAEVWGGRLNNIKHTVPRELKIMSPDDITKAKESLMVPGDRVDGLVRLLAATVTDSGDGQQAKNGDVSRG